MKIYKITALCALFTIILSVPVFSQKMTAEDVLAKHLNSIGTDEARRKNTSRLMVGTAAVRFISPKDLPANGKIALASAGEKFFWGINLDASDYPQEKFSFDGENVKVNYRKTGTISVLGNFVNSYDVVMEESIMGGTLSTSWALLNMPNKKAKISFKGKKKSNDKEVYVLDYKAKTDIEIRLFFDAETFQHIRTEYKRTFPARITSVATESSSQRDTHLKVVETFSDFKQEQNLTLPHSYDLSYAFNGQNGISEVEWKFNIMTFIFDQKIEDSMFDGSSN